VAQEVEQVRCLAARRSQVQVGDPDGPVATRRRIVVGSALGRRLEEFSPNVRCVHRLWPSAAIESNAG
jgi:hypothetical protein